MKYSNSVQTCGYDSCPCRGIHFISGDGSNNDFCVDGNRVRTRDRQLPRVLFLHQLDKYAEFLRWHQENASDLPLSTIPFEYQLAN